MPQNGRYPRNGGGGVIVERFKNDIFFSLFFGNFLPHSLFNVNKNPPLRAGDDFYNPFSKKALTRRANPAGSFKGSPSIDRA